MPDTKYDHDLHIRVPGELVARIDAVRELTLTPRSAWLRRALERQVEEEETKQ